MGPKGKGNGECSHPDASGKGKTCSKSHAHEEEEEDGCSHHEIDFHDAPCRLVYALKGNQKELDGITEAFETELRELERKFEAMSQPFFARRRALILGEAEASEAAVGKGKCSVEKALEKRAAGNRDPIVSGATDGTSKVEVIESSDDEGGPSKGKPRKGVAQKKGGNPPAAKTSAGSAEPDGSASPDTPAVKGIPLFWMNVLKRQFDVSKRDEAVLEFLTDIQCTSINGDPFLGYKLSFEFAENPFFTNSVLTKEYHQEREFNESILVNAEGCTIEWKARSLDTTVEIKKKTQKNKVKKTTRVVEKEVKVDSFFDFFDPPKIPQDEDEEEDDDEDIDYDELEERIEYDYEMGNALKDEIIPMAVDSYLGLTLSNDCNWMFPGAIAGASEMLANAGKSNGGKQTGPDGQQAECKQQ